MWHFLVTLVLVFVAHSTLALKCLTPEDVSPRDPSTLQELLRSQLDFSLNLLKVVGKQEPTDNVFISPLSIYNALLQAYFVSAGHTEKSLHDALFLPKNMDKVNILLSYRTLRIFTSTKEYTSQVHTANKLFLSKEQSLQDCVKDYFDSEIEKLDFSGSGLLHSVDVVNDWVANVTKNNIKNLISAQNLSPSTQLILVNAAYFKGLWKNEFNPQFTRNGKFQISKDKSASVLMMFQQGAFGHWRSDDLNVEILEMPYKNGDISMFILLPDSTDTSQTAAAAALLQRLDRNILLNIIKETTDPKNEEKFEVKMPKFIVERTVELTPILEALGVGDLFKSTSNLTGLTGGPKIQLNTAVHKAKIQLDEKGTEAAAATALIDTRIPGEGFICDRPFLYLLYDKKHETLLFAGLYNDPTK